MTAISKRTVRVIFSVIWGIVLTVVLTFVAFLGNTPEWGCGRIGTVIEIVVLVSIILLTINFISK